MKMPPMNETLSLVKKASVMPVPMTSAWSGRSAASGWMTKATSGSAKA